MSWRCPWQNVRSHAMALCMHWCGWLGNLQELPGSMHGTSSREGTCYLHPGMHPLAPSSHGISCAPSLLRKSRHLLYGLEMCVLLRALWSHVYLYVSPTESASQTQLESSNRCWNVARHRPVDPPVVDRLLLCLRGFNFAHRRSGNVCTISLWQFRTSALRSSLTGPRGATVKTGHRHQTVDSVSFATFLYC